jgi:hypothetical protein
MINNFLQNSHALEPWLIAILYCCLGKSEAGCVVSPHLSKLGFFACLSFSAASQHWSTPDGSGPLSYGV